jgi:hypothetical protein
MKKVLLLLTVGLTLIACGKGKSLTQEALKGKVKSTYTVSYDAVQDFGAVQKGDIISYFDIDDELGLYPVDKKEFDAKGYLTAHIISNRYQEVNYKYTYEYHKKKRIATNLYDHGGNLYYYSKHILQEGKPVSYEIYEKYSNNKYQDFVLDGFNLVSYNTCKKGKLQSSTNITYEKNLVVKLVVTNAKGQMLQQIDNQWNKQGQLLYREITDDKNKRTTTRITYDPKGNMATYDRTGTSAAESYKFKYVSFDQKGNWTERVLYSGNVPVYVQTRDIDYYK